MLNRIKRHEEQKRAEAKAARQAAQAAAAEMQEATAATADCAHFQDLDDAANRDSHIAKRGPHTASAQRCGERTLGGTRRIQSGGTGATHANHSPTKSAPPGGTRAMDSSTLY